MSMEQIREREREPGWAGAPKFSKWDAARQEWTELQFRDDPVVRAGDIPFENTPMGRIRFYVNRHIYPERATQDWHCFVMDVQKQTGKHIHQGGLVIYVIEGEGYTIIDGEREDWKAGDLLLLPVQPGGVEHQFFNKNPDAGCKWIAAIHIPMFNQLGSEFTQKDVAPVYEGQASVQRFDPQSAVVGTSAANVDDEAPDADEALGADATAVEVFKTGEARRDALAERNLYQELMKLRNQQRHWMRDGLTVVSGDDLPWEVNPWGTMRWYMHPLIHDTCIRTHIVYEQKIVPESRSGKMRHQGNALLYVLSGSGYTVIDGQRHDWGPEDLIQLPARTHGITFQHFNTSGDEARLLGFELNTTGMVGVDRGCGLVNLEPAPEWASAT